jgi:hypothetical protein
MRPPAFRVAATDVEQHVARAGVAAAECDSLLTV